MKLHYIGVRIPACPPQRGPSLGADGGFHVQIIRNEAKPSHELVSEKELSAYSRFTRTNYGVCASPHHSSGIIC